MITREEYGLLKRYRTKGYRWIARDENECVYVYKSKPIKLGSSWKDNKRGCSGWSFNDDSLPYIKWEDEKPTKILDLIQDYEVHQLLVGEKVNKTELIKKIEGILDDIGVSDYQLGECDEDTIWTISSITIRKIFSAIEKCSIEKDKQYILKFSNGQYLYSCDLGMTDESLACKLTQAEIEAVDPRLMQFAVEVK